MLHFATGRLRLSRVALYPIDITARSKKVVVRRSCIEVKEVEDGVYFFLGLCENFGPKIDTMAEQTGGRAFHTRDLQAAVLQAVNDASTYYTLFYLPRHLKFDGKIRSIKTGTTLKNARLRYRRKYFADDPGAILQPDDAASADMVIDRPTGAIPWTIVRVTKEFDSVSPSDPILAGMRYGTPASRAVVFTARVRAEDKPSPASRQQMDELQEFESFFPDRVRRAVSPEVAKFAAKPDSFRRGHARIESLPSLEPEVVQPFSIDYSIPLNQLGRRNANDGRTESDMEIAILGYDELGKKVTGLKQTVQLTIAPFQSTQSPDAEFLHTQTIHLPARTAFLRLAVRDIVAGNVGSFEIPMWAVDNPYERKRLEFPVDLENSQPSGN
jgi:hypothetical protein